MSEPAPRYDYNDPARLEALARRHCVYPAQALPGGSAPTTAWAARSIRLPVDDETAWKAHLWREAVVSAVARLAAAECFVPGDRLLVEQVALPNVAAEGWLQVTARVTVEPAADAAYDDL